MYNGIGLQTARGSGTNGYVQSNKFFVRPKSTGKPVNGGKGFEDGQGMAGLSKKPNKDILEHDRKRQIYLKLAMLEEKLIDQGYSDAEIAQKLDEARLSLEAAASGSEEAGAPADAKISDTQTHQIAARKEKQMEAFRSALGLPDQQADEGGVDGEPKSEEVYEGAVGKQKERREHSFLDRDSGRKARVDEDIDEKVGKGKSGKKQQKQDDDDEPRRRKKKVSKKRRYDSDDSSDYSDSESDRERRRRSKKKRKGRKQESESDSSDSGSGSDSESEERRKKVVKKRGRNNSSDSEVERKENKKRVKGHERHRRAERSDSEEELDRNRGRRKEEPAKRPRHDSDDSEPEPENRSDENKKKHEKAFERYRPSERSDTEEEPDRYRGRIREEPTKRQRHASGDRETEPEDRRQRRRDESYPQRHGSDDRETEPEDRRQRRRDENYHRERKHDRDEEDRRDYKHGRDARRR